LSLPLKYDKELLNSVLEVLGYAETRVTPMKEEEEGEEGEEEVKEEVKEEGERRRRSKRRRKTSTDTSTTPSSSSASPPYYHVVIKYDNDHSSEDIPLHFFLLRVVSPLSGAWIEQPQVRVSICLPFYFKCR